MLNLFLNQESKKKELLNLIELYENDPVNYIFINHVGKGGKTIRIGLYGDENNDYKERVEQN